jgi:hypothetical protein
MSKPDPLPRSIFRHSRDAIEACLTLVFTVLVSSRFMPDATEASLKKNITSWWPLRDFTGSVSGQDLTFEPEPTEEPRDIGTETLPDLFPGD